MKKVRYESIGLTIPDAWKDDTMIVWSGPMNGPSAPSVVVAHSELPDGEDFSEHVTKQQKELMEAVPQFVLHEKKEIEWNGCPAVRIKHSWRVDGPRITQFQLCILKDQETIYTVTCSDSAENFKKNEKLLEDVLDSFTLD